MQDSEKKLILALLDHHLNKLLKLSSTYLKEDIAVGHMERGILGMLLQLGLALLTQLIVLKVRQKSGQIPCGKSGKKLTNKGWRFRQYQSIFGRFSFERPSYWSKDTGMVCVVDEVLDFPKSMWSYELQHLVGSSASEVNYGESVRMINDLLNLNLSGTGSERNVEDLSVYVPDYYAQKQLEVGEAAIYMSASFDGKGVPKIKDKDKGKGKGKDKSEIAQRLAIRLGKGQKRGFKQMATVGVEARFEPKTRDAETILAGLMKLSLSDTAELSLSAKQAQTQKETSQATPNTLGTRSNNWHEGIHRRGFLADQDKCIAYELQRIKKQMKHPDSRFVVPIDAGIGLEDKVLKYVKQYELETHFDGIILDLIHVAEYVWATANAILGANSPLRAKWVADVLRDILKSNTQKVINDLDRIIEKSNLSESKLKLVQNVRTYFSNHKHKMDYASFLKKGYPISSALVESTCKHLVKARMEQSGMRWSSKGAQSMLDVRAVKINGDMEDFIDFVTKKQRKQTYKLAA